MGFYGLADMPIIFPETIAKTLNYKTTVWQDDIIVETRGSTHEHLEEVAEIDYSGNQRIQRFMGKVEVLLLNRLKTLSKSHIK